MRDTPPTQSWQILRTGKINTATQWHPIDFIPSSALFRLMDLPNELIKLVCSHADLSVYDLMALRRTCKLTREFSSDEFAGRCFHSITVLVARSSLLAFIELSQHMDQHFSNYCF